MSETFKQGYRRNAIWITIGSARLGKIIGTTFVAVVWYTLRNVVTL